MRPAVLERPLKPLGALYFGLPSARFALNAAPPLGKACNALGQ
jgi:hypothetical protein